MRQENQEGEFGIQILKLKKEKFRERNRYQTERICLLGQNRGRLHLLQDEHYFVLCNEFTSLRSAYKLVWSRWFGAISLDDIASLVPNC
mmetsp:Transcript_3129/g.4686  ORF Transcript_3129/g.4686 Transcript_3129/m.4686 type:complete len:89 (+) Transcript_3129:848-1114(+)